MSYENSETDSQSLHQNSEPEGALPMLSVSEIEELVSFFQLLDEFTSAFARKCGGVGILKVVTS
jgi:hypothetical protein